MATEARLPLVREGSPARPEFTGERFVPGLAGARIAYEHLHRYAFARRFVRGGRVLDLGCGLGYGAEVLAPFSGEVVALDRDEECVRQARANRTHPLGPFLIADATRLPFRDGVFDAVVAFELIEHLTDQESCVAEIRRALAPSGLLLISSPDKSVYSGKLGQSNPFHPKEMTTDELLRMLAPHFDRLAVYKQRVAAGSVMVSAGRDGDAPELLVAKLEADPPALVLDPAEPDFVYNVVVCGPAAALDRAPVASVLADVGETLTAEYDGSLASMQEVVQGLERSVKEWEAYAAQIIRDKDAYLEQAVAAKDAVIARLEAAVRETQARLAEIVEAHDAAIARLRDDLQARDVALAHAAEIGQAAEARVATLQAEVARLETECAAARDRQAHLAAELAVYRDEPIVRGYLGLKRLARGRPPGSRG